jgi:spermidine synthase
MTACQTIFAQTTGDRGRRWWLGALVVAWGAQAIVTQTLLLREAIVLMYGSEFAWGVVLCAWLLGVAGGAKLGAGLTSTRAGQTRADVGLVAVLTLLGLAACVDLWVFRGARAWLGVGPGELLPLPKIALAALLLVSPTSALVGLSFPLACCVRRVHCADRSVAGEMAGGPHSGPYVADGAAGGPHGGPYLSFGRIYALESLGSLIGGATFSFWAVEHLGPLQTALLCGALTTALSAVVLARRASEAPSDAAVSHRGLTLRRAAAKLLGVTAGGALVTAIFAGDTLDRRLVERRWRNIAPGYELVAEAESKYQNLALGRRAGQFTLYCNGHVSADFPDPYTFVPLAHFWMCEHPHPQQVLVLGGAAEGLLAELLRHPVAHLDYVEPDPRQLELVGPYLAEPDRQALYDPRVTVHNVDARYFVKTQRDRFDLVIARLPEPISALCARFYTDEFFGELRRAMTPQAVLCLTAAAGPTELAPASRTYLASVRETLARHFPDLVVGWGDPAQILAATATGLLSTDPAELAARYQRRGVASPLFDPLWFAGATDWLKPDKLASRARELDAAEGARVNTDLRPGLYVQRLVLWEAASSGSHVIAWLQKVRLGQLVAALAAFAALAVVVPRLRLGGREGWASGAVTLSVGTTGFATMALSILWLYAFQTLYGYVYQRIGWIIALFMAGLVAGCLLVGEPGGRPDAAPSAGDAGRRAPSRLWRLLILVDVLLTLLALAVPLVLPALAALPTTPGVLRLVEGCISALVVATGLLGGAAFPLAGELQLGFLRKVGRASGSVVGADHAGACVGALLCGVLLVPVFGMATTAWVLAGTKLASVAALAVGRNVAGRSRS